MYDMPFFNQRREPQLAILLPERVALTARFRESRDQPFLVLSIDAIDGRARTPLGALNNLPRVLTEWPM